MLMHDFDFSREGDGHPEGTECEYDGGKYYWLVIRTTRGGNFDGL